MRFKEFARGPEEFEPLMINSKAGGLTTMPDALSAIGVMS